MLWLCGVAKRREARGAPPGPPAVGRLRSWENSPEFSDDEAGAEDDTMDLDTGNEQGISPQLLPLGLAESHVRFSCDLLISP